MKRERKRTEGSEEGRKKGGREGHRGRRGEGEERGGGGVRVKKCLLCNTPSA